MYQIFVVVVSMVGVGVSGCVGVKLNNSNELTKGPDSWFYGVSGPEREVSQNPVLVDTVVSEMSLEKKKKKKKSILFLDLTALLL